MYPSSHLGQEAPDDADRFTPGLRGISIVSQRTGITTEGPIE